MKRHLSRLWLLVIATACNNPTDTPTRTSTPEPSLVVRATDSPATGDAREPELTTTSDGRIILSWVEKTGDKRYAQCVQPCLT